MRLRPVVFALFAAACAPLVHAQVQPQSFSLRFSGPPGEYISAGQSYAYDQHNASLDFGEVGGGAVLFQLYSPPNGITHFWTLVLQPYPGTRLDPGVYQTALRWPFQGQHPGLTLFGDGRGCNTSSGFFTVLSSTYSGNNLIGIHATFEQHCEGGPLALTGEINVDPVMLPAMSSELLLLLAACFAVAGVVALRRQ